jgi:hypothetical protein
MATISIVATRSGTGPTSTITVTSGDSAARAWAPPPFNPACTNELAAVKETVLSEILRQLAAI